MQSGCLLCLAGKYASFTAIATRRQCGRCIRVPQMLWLSKKEASGAEPLLTGAFLRLAAMEGLQPLAMSLQRPG